MKIGIIIQGPLTSYGDGPNNSKSGFPAEPVVRQNIATLGPYVENIVLSTWKGSTLATILSPSQLKVIENKPLQGFDFLNQRKQFFTTYAGIEWLKHNSSCTHVLKIRTDQLIPCDLIGFIRNFYEKSQFSASNQEDFILFSEALRSESFYAGDFVVAGTMNDMTHFCEAVLSAKELVHPSNACDYMLKWLRSIDKKFSHSSCAFMRSVHTTRNSLKIQLLWHEVLKSRISLIPKEIYKNIEWRGKSMSEVMGPSIESHFFSYHDIPSIKVSVKEVRSLGKTYRLVREHWKRYLQAKRKFKQLEGQ